MAAALVLASAAKADALGVPEERRVYLRGAAYAEDPVHVAGHPELWRSPAMAAAADAALAGAGIGRRRRGPPRPLLLLRQLGVLRARCAGDQRGRRPCRDTDGWAAVPRRARVQLHDPRVGGHGRDAARRARLLRRDERRRHAHAEARLRGVVDGSGQRCLPRDRTDRALLGPARHRRGARGQGHRRHLHGAARPGRRARTRRADLRPPGGRPLLRPARRRRRGAGRRRGRRADRAHRHPDARRRDQPRPARAEPGTGPTVLERHGLVAGGSTAPRRLGRRHHRLSTGTAPSSTSLCCLRSIPCVCELDAGRLAAAAIDIPIGLAADGSPGRADIEARRRLGPRRSSVFPAPVRAVLAAIHLRGGLRALPRRACGKAISKQLFNILPEDP